MAEHSYSEQDLIELAREHLAPNYSRYPVVIVRGQNCKTWDVDGREYLDMIACYSALNHGHLHPRIVAAAIDQLAKVAVVPGFLDTDQKSLGAEKIAEFCGMEMAIFMNSGAEGVETSLKLARKWGYARKGIPLDCAEIIYAANNFHGRTITIVSFSDEIQYREKFGPPTPGFVRIPFGDSVALRRAITPHTAAFLVEPIQGEGGIIVPPEGYLRACKKICEENNVLFIADEIQTGLGRTGRTFACDYEDLKPDLFVLGKALGGGILPVSAVVGSQELLSVFQPADHGSTFGGNPLACRVALESLAVLEEEGLVERSMELGTYFQDALRSIKSPHVKEVRGKGLMIGVEFYPDGPDAHEVCMRLLREGIITKDTRKYVIRFTPPLTISREELDWALERIERVLTT